MGQASTLVNASIVARLGAMGEAAWMADLVNGPAASAAAALVSTARMADPVSGSVAAAALVDTARMADLVSGPAAALADTARMADLVSGSAASAATALGGAWIADLVNGPAASAADALADTARMTDLVSGPAAAATLANTTRMARLFPLDRAAKLVASSMLAQAGAIGSAAWMAELVRGPAASAVAALQALPDSSLWSASTLGAIGDYVANRFAQDDASAFLPESWSGSERALAVAARPSNESVFSAFAALRQDIADTRADGVKAITVLTATVERLQRSSPSLRIWLLVAILGLILAGAGDVAAFLAVLRR